ncbi:predicted protein [Nematostella vectensis]|uniref:Conserved oligomeric Golgi complex subunit 8 n=1 Tax=Nematostella vectensis TaxID=45351 RepID=A7SWX3_NEMVE|nr:predicted protein [Nematostella vectensis]|eukprot:XP_001623884.1 predicted protein [Nematostella vectensis]
MADDTVSFESDENLLKTLFRESFPESWRESPEFTAYLAQLSSSGVDRLSREPERLAEEKEQVLEQTQNLAFHNYKTFIRTAECSQEIFEDFVLVESHVESLLDKLPGFSTKCKEFMDTAREINQSRRLNSLTLARHTQLLEILEIPQLMDTCVRNNYYEEALELSSYIKRLEKKLSNIPVIQSIVQAVQGSTQLMLMQLQQQLRSSIQLPACLRVIGYLRRLEVFSEPELRIKFLQARGAWLQSVLSSVPSDDPYYHITKIIEASRVHLFDIVTQYRAIFSDDDPILSMENEESPAYSNLFHCWIVEKVSQFLEVLEKDLRRGVGGRLDSLLGQCMYFGLSFSRVGADFRGLLPPLFQSASLSTFLSATREATRSFEETMSSYTLQAQPSALKSTVLSTTSSKTGDTSPTPPIGLLEHPPLAAYTNAVLSAFNELRHCAPVALAHACRDEIHTSLAFVVKATCAFHRSEAAALNESERALFLNFAKAIVIDLVPFLDRCLAAVFPPSAIDTIVGASPLELNARHQRPTGLDIRRITGPLIPMIPQEDLEPAVGVVKEQQGELSAGTSAKENLDNQKAGEKTDSSEVGAPTVETEPDAGEKDIDEDEKLQK